MGYDVHQLTRGRKLVLGGVNILYEKGLLGHSDADVLVHAVIDALLGAAHLGDIGRLFPDSDPQYKGVSSLRLLRKTGRLVEKNGYSLMNADAVIIAESPRLAPYLDRMQSNMADALQVPATCMHVKATTHEGLGSFGKGEGIGAMCVALLKEGLDGKDEQLKDE
ncbi:2-C-methyl-D-erythritol 2,4-cyclodiphosphate synthase [Thermodesulfobacteriota bacterium]